MSQTEEHCILVAFRSLTHTEPALKEIGLDHSWSAQNWESQFNKIKVICDEEDEWFGCGMR